MACSTYWFHYDWRVTSQEELPLVQGLVVGLAQEVAVGLVAGLVAIAVDPVAFVVLWPYCESRFRS